MNLLVSGGAGFIGSNFIRYWVDTHPDDRVVAFDVLTYAGNRANLGGLESRVPFVHGDVCDADATEEALRAHAVDVVVHFAAESHNSLAVIDPGRFFRTNVLGTQVLLEAARQAGVSRFHHISTCEVYGDLDLDDDGVQATQAGDGVQATQAGDGVQATQAGDGVQATQAGDGVQAPQAGDGVQAPQAGEAFTEESPYRPRTPYNASKAGADHAVRAYHQTYGLPVTITNCANNYGPYQFPEKVIPLFVAQALDDQPLPLYESVRNRREWLHVLDHCRAIDAVLARGRIGETYHVGSGLERDIEQIADMVLDALGKPARLKTIVPDRPGHDRRYLLDCTKIRTELGWEPTIGFEGGVAATVAWYAANRAWWEPLRARAPVTETAWAGPATAFGPRRPAK